MSDGAWQFFYCVSCQTERPIDTLRRVGRMNLKRCCYCVARKGKRMLEPRDPTPDEYEPYERPAIPADVLDAYRESHRE